MKKTRAILVALLILAFSAHSQTTTPDWTIDVGGFITQVNFLKQSDVGTLIVSSSTKLIGIDPRTKKKVWETSEVKDIKEDEFKVIDGTQYIMVEFQKATALAKNKTVAIFDSYNGKMVYNSRDEDIKVRNTRIVPELKGLFIEAVKESQYFIGFLDFASSQVTWTKSFGKVKTGGIGIGALKRAIKSHLESVFNVEPVVDGEGNFIFSSKETVFCVDGKTGKEKWTKEFKDDITDFILTADKKELFVVYDDLMDKVQASTGKNAYEKPIKLGGKVNGLMPLGNTAAFVVMHSDGFNILEANGSFRWKKDASVGNISSVWPIADGFIALEENEEDGEIFKVSPEGKKIWNEELDDPVYTVQPISNGVIYITTEKANILSYDKGKDVWKKDIKIKGEPAFGVDREKKIVYVYSNKALSSFNLNDGTYKEILPELKFKDYDDEKEKAVIEPRNGGLFIRTNQNVAFVKENGTVAFNKFFTEAGMSKSARGWMKAAGVLTQIGGAVHSVNGLDDYDELRIKPGKDMYEITSKQIEAGQDINQAGTDIYNYAQSRWWATQSTKNTVYILSKWDAGTGIVVVEKDNGSETKKIAFNDKTPQYIVDEADYKLYVIVNAKELRAYSLK
jgi:outer membrane protein assembly factor BamB